MINPMQLFRFFKIQGTLLRFGFNRTVIDPDSRGLLIASYLNPWSYCTNPSNRGESLCHLLENLGPVFIKFGQLLSTRRDILPDDIADALEKLQDRVAPFSSDDAMAMIESELGCPRADVFSSVDTTPLAAASIAQVHAATLVTGESVIIKLLRPNIGKIIRKDIRLMYTCAKLLQRSSKRAARLNFLGLIEEFEHTIFAELDLLREAANASQLKRNFDGNKKLYVPAVYFPHCTEKMMVMERIHGVRISDVDALKSAGTNLQKLAEHGVEIFFTQVLRDSFFHADMHPGNLFVDISDPENPVYIGVDFGIVGTLGEEDQFYLAKNLLAFFRKDYRRVAKLHVECGWVPSDTRVDLFESAIRAVSEPIFQRPIGDISFAQLLMRLFQTAEQFNMRLQPQLLLLQKTLLNIEGLGRQLYPELDLWATAQPFLEKWLTEKHSLWELGKQSFRDLPTVLEKALSTPELLHDALSLAIKKEGREQRNWQLGESENKQTKKNRGSGWLGLGLGVLIGTAALVWQPLSSHDLMWGGIAIGGLSLLIGAIKRR